MTTSAGATGDRHGGEAEGGGVHHRFVHFTDRGHMGITDEVVKEARAFADTRDHRRVAAAISALQGSGVNAPILDEQIPGT